MEIYDSEQEQIDALKKWWDENGRTVIAGLVIGIGGVFGWTYWQNYETGQAEAASAHYQQVANLAEARNYPQTMQLGEQLIVDYPKSGYAPLTALLLAKAAYENGNRQDAERHLRWTLENAESGELQTVARHRLARLVLDGGDPEGALTLLDSAEAGSFEGAFEELRGDILVAQDKTDEAREAYTRALAIIRPTGATGNRVQMKLDDLGRVSFPTEDSLPGGNETAQQ